MAALTVMHAGGRNLVVAKYDPKAAGQMIDREGIKAVCVLKPEARLSAQELIDFVAGRIARYKKPNYVQFVDALPKKEDGSIDRAKVTNNFRSRIIHNESTCGVVAIGASIKQSPFQAK